jgi:hypothetical protein
MTILNFVCKVIRFSEKSIKISNWKCKIWKTEFVNSSVK